MRYQKILAYVLFAACGSFHLSDALEEPTKCITEWYIEIGGAKIPVSSSVSFSKNNSEVVCPEPDKPKPVIELPVVKPKPAVQPPVDCPGPKKSDPQDQKPIIDKKPSCNLNQCTPAKEIASTITIDQNDPSFAWGCPCLKGESPQKLPLSSVNPDLGTGCPSVDGTTKAINGVSYIHHCNKALSSEGQIRGPITVKSLNDCAQICNSDPQCKGLTYFSRASEGKGSDGGALEKFPPGACWHDNLSSIKTNMVDALSDGKSITIIKSTSGSTSAIEKVKDCPQIQGSKIIGDKEYDFTCGQWTTTQKDGEWTRSIAANGLDCAEQCHRAGRRQATFREEDKICWIPTASQDEVWGKNLSKEKHVAILLKSETNKSCPVIHGTQRIGGTPYQFICGVWTTTQKGGEWTRTTAVNALDCAEQCHRAGRRQATYNEIERVCWVPTVSQDEVIGLGENKKGTVAIALQENSALVCPGIQGNRQVMGKDWSFTCGSDLLSEKWGEWTQTPAPDAIDCAEQCVRAGRRQATYGHVSKICWIPTPPQDEVSGRRHTNSEYVAIQSVDDLNKKCPQLQGTRSISAKQFSFNCGINLISNKGGEWSITTEVTAVDCAERCAREGRRQATYNEKDNRCWVPTLDQDEIPGRGKTDETYVAILSF